MEHKEYSRGEADLLSLTKEKIETMTDHECFQWIKTKGMLLSKRLSVIAKGMEGTKTIKDILADKWGKELDNYFILYAKWEDTAKLMHSMGKVGILE
ncbi:MAG: hypothetical protein LBN19_04580 [Endomicrobium sp.]|jgi:hypothetical protein|nr:hypothetical protein [Endomicrobium sp.]